ncbi:MAG: hypothetical protein AAGJ84_01850 [Pseudomonadota bacterium]
MSLRTTVSAFALLFAAACTQGSDIVSPGPAVPVAPPAGGGGGGGGGGGTTVDCPTGFTQDATTVGGLTTCVLSGVISDDLTLPFVAGTAYRLDGRVEVGVDVGGDGADPAGDPAILTIAAGVTIFGDEGDDFLVVNRGSQIDAVGAVDAPIVFTSADDLERQNDGSTANDDGGDATGEWGGLVLLGRAPINDCRLGAAALAVDCENVVEGVENPDRFFGGDQTGDDSGELRYVQVRFAGNELSSGNELNGITFAGIGDGTDLSYIQVHNNDDDGVEFFGGTADVRYLVLTGNDDDSIDTDLGYQGNIQFAVIQQRATSGDNLFEASSTTGAAAPLAEKSNYNIANFTAIGFERGDAFRLNEGHVGQFVNGVVVENTADCFRWQDAGNDNATFEAGEDPTFNSVLFDCADGLVSPTDDPGGASTANGVTVAPLAVAADANNIEATNSLTQTFINGATEDGVTAFDPTTLDPFFEAVDYIGAVEDANDTWWEGWSCGLTAVDPC